MIITDFTEFSNALDSVKYEIKKFKRKEYINIPCSFDIETTSTYINENKISIMYAFMLDINHIIYYGRDWEDFHTAIAIMVNKLKISDKRRIIIYVHNLSYEFGFIQKQFEWSDMLALKKRKPIYAITDFGVEFRCSLLLSGYKLEDLAKNEHLPIKKLVGDLDYTKIRHSKTLLTQKEEAYLENDVECVVYYIEKKMQYEESVAHIPLTKTSYIRRLTRENCNTFTYHKLMRRLSIDEEEYKYLKKAFQGGFTHSNPFNTGHIVKNVASYDFASSYPAVLVAEKYPMSKAMKETNPSKELVELSIAKYCCILEIEFNNIRIKDEDIDFPLSAAPEKTVTIKPEVSNGRLIRAEYAKTIITEQDFLTIRDFYDFDDYKVSKMYVYHKAYLPTEFIESLLNLYKIKTELKGVLGREDEYMSAKENINSCYGMTVTDIMRDDISYNYDLEELWDASKPDAIKTLGKYNSAGNRFLFYPWGVWVTAYARRNLFSAIKEIKYDYVYSDTDSVKIQNKEKYKYYFDNYNKVIIQKLETAMKYHNLPIEMTRPKTIKGAEKQLGVWEYEGEYIAFKCMNAKRYMTFSGIDDQTGNKNWISLTVSGLNKNTAFDYILTNLKIPYTVWKDGSNKRFYLSNTLDYIKVMNFFKDGMKIPPEFTGRLNATYICDHKRGIIEDYNGVKGEFDEYSSVHLEPSTYELGILKEFSDFLLKVQGKLITEEEYE